MDFLILFFQLYRRFSEPLIFCFFISPFCSLEQFTLMFIAVQLTQRDVETVCFKGFRLMVRVTVTMQIKQ